MLGAGAAASDGAELQFTGRAMGFTMNANVAYDNARYTKDTYSPGASHKLLAKSGDNLGVPDWTANIGLQYDTRIAVGTHTLHRATVDRHPGAGSVRSQLSTMSAAAFVRRLPAPTVSTQWGGPGRFPRNREGPA